MSEFSRGALDLERQRRSRASGPFHKPITRNINLLNLGCFCPWELNDESTRIHFLGSNRFVEGNSRGEQNYHCSQFTKLESVLN